MLKVNLNVTFLDDELKEIKGYWRGGGGGVGRGSFLRISSGLSHVIQVVLPGFFSVVF